MPFFAACFPISRARIAPKMSPRPQEIHPVSIEPTPTKTTACRPFLGSRTSARIIRFTRGWYATTFAVTRMITICMANCRRAQKPPYQESAISVTADPSEMNAAPAAT